MKTWKKKEQGKEKPTGFLSYLNQADELLQSKTDILSVDDALDLKNINKALAVRAAFKVKTTMAKVAQLIKDGVHESQRVHSLLAVDIVSMAQSHILYVAFQIFLQDIERPEAFKCPNIRRNMQDMARLFALNELTNNDSVTLYEAEHFQKGTQSLL